MKVPLQYLNCLPKFLANLLPPVLFASSLALPIPVLAETSGVQASESVRSSKTSESEASAKTSESKASESKTSEHHDADPIFAAMSDEMRRSMESLKMDQHLLPYFISYEVKDVNEITLSSILGSTPAPWRERYRLLTPRLRIGNYDFDSSFPRTSFSHYVTRVPIDDDYAVLRRALWQTTDNAYKNAIRTLEWKKAYLASNNMPDRLADMTREKAHQDIEPTFELPDLQSKWSDEIAQLSAVFKDYPELQKSKVTFVGRVVKRRFLNSEGTKIQDARAVYAIRLWAECQAPDGMQLNDYDVIASTDAETLPSIEVLKKRTEDFAQHLVDLRRAPLAEEYCGPVLFEGQGGAGGLLDLQLYQLRAHNPIPQRVVSKVCQLRA